MKINKVILVLSFLFTIGLCSFSVYADSTSDSLTSTLFEQSAIARNGSLFDAPFIAPEGEIDKSNGSVNMRIADLTVPGKNGMDVSVIRFHNSYNSDYSFGLSESTYNKNMAYCIGIPYKMYMDGDYIGSTYIAYLNDLNFLETAYMPESELNYIETDRLGTEYFEKSELQETINDIELVYDKNKEPVYIYKGNGYSNGKRREVSYNIELGNGWFILVPQTQATSTTILSKTNRKDYKRYIEVQFDDGTKEIVKYEYKKYNSASVSGKLYEFDGISLSNANTQYTAEMSLEAIQDSRGFTYNIKLTHPEGKAYYFHLPDPMSSGDGKITAIEDRYNNLILYEHDSMTEKSNMTITDTYGRKIYVSQDSVSVEAGDMTKRVDYSCEKIVNEETDPNEYYEGQHSYKFIVRSYDGNDNSGNVEETVYDMDYAYSENMEIINYYEGSYYRIDSVEYPSKCKREYTYEENPNAELQYDNADIGYYMYRVATEKVYENNIVKREKSFSYDGEWESMPKSAVWNTYKTFKTTENLPNGHTKEELINYDSLGRIISCENIYKEGRTQLNKQKTIYSYYDPVEILKLQALRRSPLINIRKYENGEMLSSEDVRYVEKAKKLRSSTVGETDVDYVYDSTYYIPTSVITNQLNKDDLRQVNTLTSDKKSIAKTQIYEGSTLLRTINYTYNTDGTISSQSETNASGTVRTEYAYNYADDSSYTVTTTVKNVTDNDGNSKNVSTITDYDSLGRMISQRDANGYVTRYEYDMLGRLTKQINPDNTTQEITYDIEENNIYATDENNYGTTYDYSPTGNLNKVYLNTDSSKVLTEYTYDALDRKTSETVYQDIGGQGTSNEYTYDDFNRVSTVTTKHGDTVLDVATNTYERSNQTITSYDDEEIDVSAYDKIEMLIYDVNVSSNTEYCRISICLDGEEIILEDFFFHDVATYIIDVSQASSLTVTGEHGTFYSAINPFTKGDITLCGGASQTVTTTYQGDENFVNPTKVAVIDGYGNVVSESYYDGEVAEDNLLNKNIYEYDYQGNVIKTLGGRTYMENLGDYTTKTEYDYMGNPTKQYRADGSYITNVYDQMGNLTSTTDYMGNTTTYTYDALSRVIKTTAPFDSSRTAETLTYYDNCGNVIKTKQQNDYVNGSPTYRTTEYRYDNRNRQTVTIANDGTQDIYTQYAYDGVGNVTQMITGQTEQIYDMNGTLPSGATREIYEYDRFGNVIKTTDNEGRIATAEYNLIGKPLTETDKNGETKYTLYNPYGSPAMVEKGDFIQMFEYTANNLLLSVGTMKERLSNITYTYDKLGRVIKEQKMGSLQGTPVSDYTYDVNGNRKSYTLTYNGSQVYSANYTYDNLDRLTTVSYNDMDVSDISYSYDANNRVVSENTTDNIATYTYNSAGLVTNLVNSNGADFNYSYNVDGNQSAMQSNRGEWIFYEYDGLGQLISEDGMSEYVSHYKTYEYDTRGNRISSESEDAGGQFTESEYTYDSTNRLLTRKDTVGTAETNTSFQYDNNGNLVQKIKESLTDATGANEELSLTQANADGDLTDDLVTTYTYNDFGELSGIITENNTISYLYDATGKRSLEIKNGNYGIMIWDGDYVVAETEKNNVKSASKPIANKYFRGYKLFANKSTSGVGYYTYDAHGSVIGMSNESYVYDAFGNQITDTTSYNPFRYCGEYQDLCSGLIYLRNRYYDPSIGRFISEDPIRSGTNWYVYANNNPLKYVDPLGLESVIFVANGMEAQAEIRKEFYTERYGTDSYKIIISSPKEFVDKWNQWFALCDKLNIEIDAIEIISHGSIEGKVGKDSYGIAYSTGYIYFDDKDDRLYARNIKGISNKDRSIEELNSVNAKEMNISSCNGANKDTYNVLYGFMQRVKADKYSGFDGGAQWDSKLGDHIDGGGDYDADRPWYMGGPWYYVKRYQHTWWKYVDKQNGVPVREREGRRYFE